MYINTLKLQQISLITKSIDTYNSSNSRYLLTTKFIFSTFRLVNNQHQVVKELTREKSQTIFVEKEALLNKLDSNTTL